MKLTITDKVFYSVSRNSYVVEITTYQGDGEGDTVLKTKPFKEGRDEAKLESILKTLERVSKLGGQTNSTLELTVPGFAQWFVSYTREEMRKIYPGNLENFDSAQFDLLWDLSDGHSLEWPADHSYSSGLAETLADYKVFYYDNNFTKFNVTVVF